MKIIVCGGRDFDDHEHLIAVLDKVHAKKKITMIIEGGCKGADSHAAVWAESNKIGRVTCFPNWGNLGNSAGPARNKLMLDLGVDGVIAFDGGKGTQNMISQAKNRSIKVMRA
tara:strand:- start:23237 stop:23575 length:339 start_codon:yes stop_codon:yes gene_type:complete